MRISINEVETSVLKAARGAQLSEGLSCALSRACAWLCARDIDALTSGLIALDNAKAQLTAPAPRPRKNERAWTFAPTPVALLGPSVFDLLHARCTSKVVLEGIDAPLLLLGYGALACATSSMAFRLHTGDQGTITVNCEGIEWPSLEPITLPRERMSLSLGEVVPPSEVTHRPSMGHSVESSLWHRLQTRAARTYVPASAQSRARGAGAGRCDD